MNWFTNLFKKQVPVVTEENNWPLPEPVLVSKKATGMPLVSDYPHKEYKAYWETDFGKAGHKHTAKVRFYSFEGKRELLSESLITNSSLDEVRNQVASLVRTKMASYKRV